MLTDLFLYDTTTDAPERRISFDEIQILGHVFSDDSNIVYYSTLKEGVPKLWQYDIALNEHMPLVLNTNTAIYPSIVRGKQQLVFARQERNFYIGEVPLSASQTASPVVQSYASNMDPAFDHNSSRLAYTSAISGKSEIWITDSVNNNYKQLTRSEIGALSPAWSSDGNKIVYVSYNNQKDTELQWQDVKHGMKYTLNTGLQQLWAPQFSLDQQSVFVSAM